jgi:acetaldehyde dehydrogenase
MKKAKVAILGTGNIGTDLLVKIMRSPYLECAAFIGRSVESSGIAKAKSLGVFTSTEGIQYIKTHPESCDIVFDATSAISHLEHAPVLDELKKYVIDLTPAKIGKLCVPAVNMSECFDDNNVNMVTCGGQAAIPIVYALGKSQKNIEYIEVVSSVASSSAGSATRINLDEYIHTTEKGIAEFSGVENVKAILNLNPAVPHVNMQTTIFAKVPEPNIQALQLEMDNIVRKIQEYVPGYEIVVKPFVENARIVTMLRVRGRGDFLPEFAGNLDIINCAAVAMAEQYAKQKLLKLS